MNHREETEISLLDDTDPQVPSQEILDAITYIPAQQSNVGEINADDESNIAVIPDHSNYGGSDTDARNRTANEQSLKRTIVYNMRERPRIHYSAVSSAKFADSIDQHKLGQALKSANRLSSLNAISEEFYIITKNDTWKHTSASDIPSNEIVLPSGKMSRTKLAARRQVSRLKACLLVRGNLQSDFEDYAELYAPIECIELEH